MVIETAADVIAALRRKYCRPEWLLFDEVEVGSGDRVARVDAIALNLWRSRGLELHGFEIKCSRADFLTEMRDPGKAEAGMAHCDKWWLVVNGKEVAYPAEVPKGWGLIVPRGSSLVVKKQADRRDDATPLDVVMMLTFLKKTLRMSIPDEQLVAMREEGRRLGEKKGEERAIERYKYQIERYGKLQECVGNFEKVSGIRLGTWPREGLMIGRALEVMRRGGLDNLVGRFEGLMETAEYIRNEVEKKLALLEETKPAVNRLQQQESLFDE